MSKDIIITNNPLVAEKYSNCKYIEGGFYDVMLKTRDILYKGGYRLITHPLPASSRMFMTPTRSIIIRESHSDIFSMELIQQSMDNYKKIMGKHKSDYVHKSDYQLLDLNHLSRSINEQKKNDQMEEDSRE